MAVSALTLYPRFWPRADTQPKKYKVRMIRTGLDSIDRRIRQRATRAADEADDHVLIRGQVGEVGLHPVGELLDFLVRREIRACVFV